MVEICSLHHYVISGNSKVITTGRLVESITDRPHSINAFSQGITYDIINSENWRAEMAAYDEKLCMAMGSLETEFGTLVPSLKGATAQKSHPGQYSLVQIVQVYHWPLKHART